MEKTEKKLTKIYSTLNRNKIPYITIGGISAILYGVERPTYDVDIAIPDRRDIIEKTLACFRVLGYATVHKCEDKSYLCKIGQLTTEYVLKKRCVELRNDKKALFPIDIMPVDYGSLLSIKDREVKIHIGRTTVLIPALPDLIKLKTMAGRTKDIEDVKTLKTILKKGKNKKYYE